MLYAAGVKNKEQMQTAPHVGMCDRSLVRGEVFELSGLIQTVCRRLPAPTQTV